MKQVAEYKCKRCGGTVTLVLEMDEELPETTPCMRVGCGEDGIEAERLDG